jgi:cysteine-rich repeat protein
VGCITTLNDALCDDEDVCTLGDHCHLGDCLANLDLVCNDNNPCTTDNCNSIAGCQFIPNSESCDDGNACTEDDICAAGVCKAGISVICDDGKLCTTDTCSPDSGCLNIWNDVPCDDGSICTQQDQCSDGECIGGPTLVCDDGNVCTDDSCGAETGCVFALNSAICEDGNACTENDTCSGGWCAPGTPVICNDSNVCTDDSCDPKTGCTGSFNAESCNDANACTTNDICSGGSCTGGPPPSCDLGEPCREYGCDINTGCTSSLLDNCCGNGQLEGSEECDDGNLTPSDGCESDCKLPTIPTVSLNGYIWYLAEKGANCNVTCASVGKSCISLVQANYIESSCSANVAVCPNFFPGLPCVTDGDGPRVVYSGNTPTQCKYRNWNYGGMTCTYSAGGNTAHMCACQ